MSGFKRIQSKVFWGKMAVNDARENLPLIPSLSAASSVASLPNVYSNLGMLHSESETSPHGSDVSDGNVTAIRVNEPALERDQTNESSERKRTREESPSNTGEKSRSVECIEGAKCLSNFEMQEAGLTSMSPCNRSLDSGFSDSDRSNSSGICHEDGTPRRRRRRRQRRIVTGERPQLHHRRLSTLWTDCENLPDPAHTSTPKADRNSQNSGASHFFQSEELIWSIQETRTRNERFEEDHENSRVVAEDRTMEEECLGDFLYATEPPEDEYVQAISNVSSVPSASLGNHESYVPRRESSTRRSIERRIDRKAAVKAWLENLVTETEDECFATLQSKTLPKRKYRETHSEETQTRDLRLLTSSATAAATELLVRADAFTRHLEQIIEKLSKMEYGREERELLRSIEDEAFSILSELGGAPPRRIHEGNLRSVLSQLEALRKYVDSVIDSRLDFYIKRVVRGLEEAPREGGSAARGALAALTALGLAGNRAGSSIARSSGVRALLTSLVSAGRLSSELRASSLRALASVCCCPLAIEQFIREDGPEILLDFLSSETTPESEKMEAAALVVQITAPWTNALGLRNLEPYADDLVNFLTRLAEMTNCSQTLLLSAAALNNLADSKKFLRPILEQETVRKLLKCVKKMSGGNVWLMEQVASLIGKLAKFPEAIRHLAASRASVALVCFLRMGTPGLEDAYSRLENTAAEALTRLCVDPEIARQVVAVGGADCLPSIRPNKRFDSNDDEDRDEILALRHTKSLRRAYKKAAKEIDVAKACHYSIRD